MLLTLPTDDSFSVIALMKVRVDERKKMNDTQSELKVKQPINISLKKTKEISQN